MSRLPRLIILFLNKFMANSKKSDSIKPPHSPRKREYNLSLSPPRKGGDLEGVKKAEQKFSRELKNLMVDIKKLHEDYDAALTKRRLSATKKLLSH